jgi:hypothetical protein
MASETRHAAWQTERRFALRLLPEGGAPTDLADGLTDFLDAFDLAFEWLNREDPARTGTATLAIVETSDGVSEEVWTYPPAPGNGQELVTRLGFNPLNWPGVPGFSADERKTRLRQRVGATDPRADAAVSPKVDHVRTATAEPVASVAPPNVTQPSVAPPNVTQPSVAPPNVTQPSAAPPRVTQPSALLEPEVRPVDRHTTRIDRTELAALRATVFSWIRTNVRTAWDDRLSRCCLIGSGASLWFSVGLADPQFLVPLLVFLPALWWRERNREAPVPDVDNEDWL